MTDQDTQNMADNEARIEKVTAAIEQLNELSKKMVEEDNYEQGTIYASDAQILQEWLDNGMDGLPELNPITWKVIDLGMQKPEPTPEPAEPGGEPEGELAENGSDQAAEDSQAGAGGVPTPPPTSEEEAVIRREIKRLREEAQRALADGELYSQECERYHVLEPYIALQEEREETNPQTGIKEVKTRDRFDITKEEAQEFLEAERDYQKVIDSCLRTKTLLDTILTLDPKDDDARNTQNAVRELQEAADYDLALLRLKREFRLTLLEKYYQEVHTIRVPDGESRDELEKLIQMARNRYKNLKEVSGEKTSLSRSEDYKEVRLGWLFVLDKIKVGETHFYDPDFNQYRDINEVMRGFDRRLVETAAAFIEVTLSRIDPARRPSSEPGQPKVNVLMEEEGPRDPAAALKRIHEIEDTVEFDEIYGTTGISFTALKGGRSDIEKVLVRLSELREAVARLREYCEEEFEPWKQADVLLNQASVEKNDLDALALYQKARSVYPFHHGVMKPSPDYYTKADMYLTVEARDALQHAADLLEQETQEATEQRKGNRVQPLQTFNLAQKEVTRAWKLAVAIEPERRSFDLSTALNELLNFGKTIDKRRNRRNKIREKYNQLDTLLKQGHLTAAKNAYEKLDEDTKSDAEIGLIYPRIEEGMSDDDHMREAQTAFDFSNWERVLIELGKVQKLSEKGQELRGRATIFRLRQKINKAWNTRYYGDCEEEIINLENFRHDDPAVQELAVTISGNLRLDEKRRMIDQMKELDAQKEIPQRFEDVTKQLEKLTSAEIGKVWMPAASDEMLTDVFGLLDELARLDEMFTMVDEQVILYSTLKGKLAEQRGRLEHDLCEGGDMVLGSLLDQANPSDAELERGWRLAEMLHQRSLDTHRLSRLCRDVVIQRTEKKAQAWAAQNEWLKIMLAWEGIYNDYEALEMVRQKIDENRRKYLIHEIDSALNDQSEAALSLARARGLLDKSLVLEGIGSIPQFHFSTEKDVSIKARLVVLQTLEKAEKLFNEGGYETSVLLIREMDLDQQVSEKQIHYGLKAEPGQQTPTGQKVDVKIEERARLESALARHLDRLTSQAIANLRAEAAAHKEDLSLVALAWARVLQLDPKDAQARTWYANPQYASSVQGLINRVAGKAKAYTISTGEVSEQIREMEELDREIVNLLQVVAMIGTPEKKEQNKKNLEMRHERVGEILDDLRTAKRIIDHFAENGESWKRCIRYNLTNDLQNAVNQLAGILPYDPNQEAVSHSEVVWLSKRIADYSAERKKLETAKAQLGAQFPGDEFEEAQKQLNTIDAVLERHDANQPGSDPYGVIDAHYAVDDPYLDNIGKPKQIPYYPDPQKTTWTILTLLNARIANVKLWKDYQAKIQMLYNEWVLSPAVDGQPAVNQYPDIDTSTPTLRMKLELEKYLTGLLRQSTEKPEDTEKRLSWRDMPVNGLDQFSNELPRIPARPEEPLSSTAGDICEQVEQQLVEIAKNFLDARRDWRKLREKEAEYRARLDLLARTMKVPVEVAQKNDAEEMKRFWRDGNEPDLWDFIVHLDAVAKQLVR